MDIRFLFKNLGKPSNGLQDFVRSELRKKHLQDFITQKLKRSVTARTGEEPSICLTFSDIGGSHTATFDFKSKTSTSAVQVTHTSNDLYEAVGFAADKLSRRLINL